MCKNSYRTILQSYSRNIRTIKLDQNRERDEENSIIYPNKSGIKNNNNNNKIKIK